MTQNYFKGKITVVFPATPTSPLYGKILPVWGNPSNKGDQINFNMFALRENKKFPEEGGACEIDYKDTTRWHKKNNGNAEFFTPNVPFVVYFKIKATEQRDGSVKLVAVSIFAPDKIDATAKAIADGITKQPPLKELLSTRELSPIEKLEAALESSPRPKDNRKPKKVKKVVETEEEIDYDDEGAALEAMMQQQWKAEASTYSSHQYSPVDNKDTDEEEPDEVESTEGKEDDDIDYDEYDEYYEVDEHRKERFDDADNRH